MPSLNLLITVEIPYEALTYFVKQQAFMGTPSGEELEAMMSAYAKDIMSDNLHAKITVKSSLFGYNKEEYNKFKE